jgi:hypothetical protein
MIDLNKNIEMFLKMIINIQSYILKVIIKYVNII